MFKRTMLSIVAAVALIGAENLLAQEEQDSPKSGPKQKQVLAGRQRPRGPAEQPRREVASSRRHAWRGPQFLPTRSCERDCAYAGHTLTWDTSL